MSCAVLLERWGFMSYWWWNGPDDVETAGQFLTH